jgi:nucleoside-diphosphate-sugar epimerase
VWRSMGRPPFPGMRAAGNRALVTGGIGFIVSHLVECLLRLREWRTSRKYLPAVA